MAVAHDYRNVPRYSRTSRAISIGTPIGWSRPSARRALLELRSRLCLLQLAEPEDCLPRHLQSLGVAFYSTTYKYWDGKTRHVVVEQ